jgi:hypothetical protein
MQAVHRSFFASIHLATERGLTELCERNGIAISSSLYESSTRAIEKIEAAAGENESVHRALKELRVLIPANRPFFNDYLNAALSNSQLGKKTKTQWRRFFGALSIVRNKASHSDTTLTESERKKLAEGGFAVLISDTGELVMNPRMYVQAASYILDFFDVLSPPSTNSRSIDAISEGLHLPQGGSGMSLIIAVYVPTGIVISGDSRTTGILLQQVPQPNSQDPNAQITVQTQVVISDAANKIFLLYDRFGVGAFGDAIINNMPIAHYIEQFEVQQTNNTPQSVQQCANELLLYFRGLNPIPKVGFVVAGYDGVDPWVMGVDLSANSIQRVNIQQGSTNLDYGIVRGGDTAIVDRLLSQPQFNPPFSVMNLQDAVDYSRHLIRSTIDQMRFEPRFPTVGGEIDTLVLNPDSARFLKRKELQCS